MEYSFEIEVEVPYPVMIELLEDPSNLSQWQPELVEHSLLVGNLGQVGAQSKLTYNMNGRPVEITELITARNLPHEKTARYETRGVVMHVTNRFAEIGPTTTFWRHETRIQFTNFLIKLLGFFMPQVFRDQSWRYMNLFKRFAEETYRTRAS